VVKVCNQQWLHVSDSFSGGFIPKCSVSLVLAYPCSPPWSRHRDWCLVYNSEVAQVGWIDVKSLSSHPSDVQVVQ
jgi:hypothetical protein